MANVYVDDTKPPLMILRPPNYYDSPEGKNPWEKVWGVSKYAILSATIVSIHDGIFLTKARNIIEAANVTAFWMVPAVGLAATWASATFIATNVRGKDDMWNYAIGVIACMPVLHAWRKSTAFTMWSTVALMGAALLKKDSVESGWLFFPKPEYDHGKHDVYDFSVGRKEWPRRPY